MISYTVTVYNELIEISRILGVLKENMSLNDELVIVQTYRDNNEQDTDTFLNTQKICQSYANIYQLFHFQNKFADLKNYTNSLASKSYIINLDADELVTAETLRLWKEATLQSPADIYYVPRVNIVDNYTIDDIKNYQWNINNQGWINWPDYQPRIFKNNKNIRWVGDVHERLEGTDKIVALPAEPRMAIIHHKSIEKQRQQNALYISIIDETK